MQHPDRPELRLTHDTIYQEVYRPDRGGLTRSRSPLLRTGRTYRKRRRSREQRIPRFTDRSKSIHDQLITVFSTLPEELRQSLAWDQGVEMGRHAEFTAAIGTPVYFCDPASPWQRGSNENTNGPLRQYFPRSSDLSAYTAEDLTAVAAELNDHPRKVLGWDTPAQRFTRLLAEAA